MLFSSHPRTHYENAPAHEVICQLRFPTILTINTTEPADFQEAIRDEFPRYSRRQENAAPKVIGLGGPHPKVEQQPPIINYHFLSEDGRWKLNLTRDFIALSTVSYTGWEDFAHYLDKILATFIQIYKPAYFQRVGLRYVNIFSRSRLGLEHEKWADLIAPAYIGPLCEPDVQEDQFINCGSDLQLKLDSSCLAKVHTGMGQLRTNNPNAPQDPEVKFLFDMDLAMGGNVPCTLAAGALETLHSHGTRVFEGALTDRLRDAMRPD